jgi:hypothetical protein
MKNFFLTVLLCCVFAPLVAHAQIKDPSFFQKQLTAGGVSSGLTTDAAASNPTDPRILVGQIFTVVLSILGTYFVGLVVLSGYRLIKADGDSGKIDEAKGTIQKAIIGLVIVLVSYSVATFVVQQATKAINNAAPQDGFNPN